MDYRKGLLFILIFLEVFLSIYMVYEGNIGGALCITGEGCKNVQNSIYGQIFGIKLTELAIIAFVALLVVYYLVYFRKIHYNFFFASTILGAGLSAYFIYLQLFVLKQICSNCMIVDGVMIIIFLVAGYEFIELKKSGAKDINLGIQK